MLCAKHKIEMRPVRNDGGQIIDTGYLCEPQEKNQEDSTVSEKRRKLDGEED